MSGWIFFMESTSSVRVNGLLYSSELFEENFIFFRFDFIEFCVELTGGVFRKCFCKKICYCLFTCYFVVCYGEVF